MMKRSFLAFLASFGTAGALLGLSVAFGQGAPSAPPAATPPADDTNFVIPVDDLDTDPLKDEKELLPDKSYRESKLTRDESELQADKRKLIMTKGEDKVVDLDFEPFGGANGISVGNPKILDFTLVSIGDRKQIVFKPLDPGTTTVTVRDQGGFIKTIFAARVVGKNLIRVAKELKILLRDVEGIRLRIIGNKVVVDGEILVPADYGRLFGVLREYGSDVLNLAQISKLSLQYVAKRIQKDINLFAPNVTTRVVNDQVWLEGTVDDGFQAQRAARVAELYLPSVTPFDLLEGEDNPVKRLPPRAPIQNFLVINPPPPKKQDKLVRIAVHFVELAKDYNKFFGFKWQPGFTADPQISIGQTGDGSAGASSGASFTATISSLFPKLLSAQNAGFARILKTGTIVVRSGRRADLVDRTQVPFVSVGPNGEVSTSSAAVGLSVAVTPVILGQSDDIEMDLDMTQINLTGTAGNDAPITAEHTVKTKLYVKSKESAAVAAVNSSDIKTDFNKDDPDNTAFAGPQTSPLFSLLRSKSYSKRKGLFVIFVTPQIIENASQGTEDLKKNFRVKVN